MNTPADQNDAVDSEDLLIRTSLPARFSKIVSRLPRDSWPTVTLAPTAAHWLEIHDWYRQLHQQLLEMGHKRLIGAWDDREYRAQILPGLRYFLGHLELHHRLETEQAFPEMLRRDPQVAGAIALLNGDHVQIDAVLTDIAQAARALGQAVGSIVHDSDNTMWLIELIRQSERPFLRHLADEEDVIVPLLTSDST